MSARLTAPDAAGKVPLVYILAASHSGSTLLGMLLGSHPNLCTVGELKASSLTNPDQYRCSCRQRLGECQFWRAVAERMAASGHEFDIRHAGTDLSAIGSDYVARILRPLHRGRLLELIRDAALNCSPMWRAAVPRLQARNAALARAICDVSAARMIVDSSKTGVRLKYLLRNPGLDIRVVRLVRDGRAVALTYTDPSTFADATDPAMRGDGTGCDNLHERLQLEEAAREWRRSNEEAMHIVAGLPADRWIQIRYEDLCADPGSELGRVFEFLGVEPVDTRIVFRTRDQHVIGNGMRMDVTAEVRLDDRWRSVLGPKALAVFDSVAGDLNARLGYA